MYGYVVNRPSELVDLDGQNPVLIGGAVVGGFVWLGYKIVKACRSIDRAMDKSIEEGKRESEAMEKGNFENAGLCPKAFKEITDNISKGARMPGTSIGGPAAKPGPAFPSPGGVPLPSK